MKLLLPLLFMCSCSSTIIPSKEMGSTVALLDHGRHASLMIQYDQNTMYRYSYGDWDFYALGKGTFFNGLKALFWPTTGGLGRKKLEGPVTEDNISRHLLVGVEKVIIIKAKTDKVLALKEMLDKIYLNNQKSLLYNTEYDMEFVHHPETYWALNNSNQMVARWLEAVGVKVKGAALFSNWDLVFIDD
jgi:hypothetical protein